MNISAPSLLQAAAAAAGGQQYPAGALYVVATPIGNLADLTLRAIHTLALVDAVACEDTRVTGALLRHLGLEKSLLALHEHNEQSSSQAVVSRLARGERVAYVSDAGTPAISDPGAVLVSAVRTAGYRAVPIPGASSALAALSVAGDVQGKGFRFGGFLPTRARERAGVLAGIFNDGDTHVLFEAPHRIEALLHDIAAGIPMRRVTVCRELTKQFENVVTLAAAELPAWLAADPNHRRGEFVVVLHAELKSIEPMGDDRELDHVLSILMRGLPLKQAVNVAVELTGKPRNALYQRALAMRDANADDDD